ncbi:MAG: hypothetical protein V2J89_17585, partial [Halieaceae bacterium]|nr:hypothetical protein [Halieaceae bacterium]
MIKEFSQNRRNVILNFSIKYCKTPDELLDSEGFNSVLKKYVKSLQKRDSALIERMFDLCGEDDFNEDILRFFKLCMILDKKDIEQLNKEYKKLLKHTDTVVEFIEGLYNYWRSRERYALIQSSEEADGIESTNFIDAKTDFTNLILKTYRRIEENLLEQQHNIYRQLSAGINAGLVLHKNGTSLPQEYDKIKDVQIIQKIVFTPPFIIYPKENKRSGLFTEVTQNPLDYLSIHQGHFFCYPAKVGASLAFIYFHRDFMNHGISLCNLFDLAKPAEYKDRQPDLIYVYGARLENHEKRTVYYHDKRNDIYVGYVSNTDEVDYFGYMKKMILTLHNVRMIDKGHLPIHGAMVNITLKNGI